MSANSSPPAVAAIDATISAARGQRLANMDAVRQALDVWSEESGFRATTQLLTDWQEAAGLKTAGQLLGEVTAAYAESARQTIETINVSQPWRDQARVTLELVASAGAVVIPEQVRAALQSESLPATLLISDGIRSVLEAAGQLAAEELHQPSESDLRDETPTGRLSDDQREQLQIALLGAMAEIAANVALFASSRQVEIAGHLFALLAALMLVYQAMTVGKQ